MLYKWIPVIHSTLFRYPRLDPSANQRVPLLQELKHKKCNFLMSVMVVTGSGAPKKTEKNGAQVLRIRNKGKWKEFWHIK